MAVNILFMIVDRTEIEEYPFDGSFYDVVINEELPLEEQVEEEVVVLETKCDIQESQKSDSGGNITATFNIYFPFDKEEGVKVRRGMIFRGSIYGMEVNGRVIGVYPSQLGGCACYIKDLDV